MAGYTRQSTFTDGDVITAAHSNDEFDQVLAAFVNTSGHKHDGTAAEGPVIGLIGDPGVTTPLNKVVIDNPNNQIEFSVDVSSSSVEQLVIKDGVIEPTTTNDIDLGASSKQFKDLFLDGTATIDGLAMPTTTVTDILDEDNMASDSATALATQQSIKAYVDSQVTAQDLDFQADSGGALAIDLDSETLTFTGGTGIDTSGSGNAVTFAIDSTVATLTGSQTLTNKTLTTPIIAEIDSGAAITLDATTDIVLDADGGDITLKDGGTTFGNLNNSSGELVIQSGSTPTTAITMSGADVTIAGDLTISGDDLTMGTNTSGHIMVADGSNFNPVAVSGDVTISSAGAVTIANNAVETAMVNANVITGQTQETTVDSTNDLLLFFDNSASALRKIPVTNLVSSVGGLSDVVADTSPQLGGDLDVNGQDIVSTSNGNISLLPNGSGKVLIDGNGSTGGVILEDGSIDIRSSTGSVSEIKFYCEVNNAHAQTLKAQPHSAGSSAVLTLPVATGTLVGSGDTGTVSNGMLAGSIADSKLSTISTAGKVDLGALEIDGGTDIGADLVDADLLIVDDGANGTERKSEFTRVKKYIYSAMSGDATASDSGALTIANGAVENAMLAGSIADSKLNTISTAGKVSIDALDIDGGTDIGAALTDSDIFIVDDGAGGTNRKATMSRLATYVNSTSTGASAGFAVAMAIAL